MKINLNKLVEISSVGFSFPQTTKDIKDSGVVIPLFEKESGHGLILTKRNANLRNHPGQISFPGGVHHQEDGSLQETAIREWEEELGVSRNSLQIISAYRPANTFTGYIIYPFVALYTGDFHFHCNESEVEKVILISLEDLNHLPFYTISNPRFPEKEGIYYFDLGDDLLWGATCHILVGFLRELAGFERKPKQVTRNMEGPPFFDPKKWKT